MYGWMDEDPSPFSPGEGVPSGQGSDQVGGVALGRTKPKFGV